MITRDFFEKGKSKICISLMVKNINEVEEKLQEVILYNPDIIEFRTDYFEDIYDKNKLSDMLKLIREKTKLPILFTIRTSNEGGELKIEPLKYKEILLFVATELDVDAIDIEYMMGKDIFEDIVLKAHERKILIIGSYHDFDKTPEEEYIYDILKNMYKNNMDVSKVALMPKSKKDVLKVINVTEKINDELDDILTITMSMGGIGSISRIIGGYFGSVMTFGAASEASAPGQINARELREIKERLY